MKQKGPSDLPKPTDLYTTDGGTQFFTWGDNRLVLKLIGLNPDLQLTAVKEYVTIREMEERTEKISVWRANKSKSNVWTFFD